MPVDRVLVVDDELSMRQFLSILLEREGYDVVAVGSAESALESVETRWPDLVLTDLSMPGMDGLELLRELKALGARTRRDVEVVVLTAYGTTQSAVEAMKNGAADYVLKPFNNDELKLVVKRALGRGRLEAENERLRAELHERYHFGRMVGSSRAMAEVYDMIRRVKNTRINCLIQGESGTGKEMVARAIHYSGVRSEQPFVAINCGAIPENLVESELFGHKKGAFTGAVRDKPGLMQSANQGTLFLDEVASLTLNAQVKLLRALQERRVTPVGGVQEVEVDVRVIAASNVDLKEAVREGRFREDLYYRLDVVRIEIPPLRDRRDDIPELARHFAERFSEEYGKAVTAISPDAMRVLRSWYWPGNVRELQNVLERAVALCKGRIIDVGDLPARIREEGPPPPVEASVDVFPQDGINLDELLQATERRWLEAALKAAEGNKSQAARLLKMSFRSLRYRLQKYGLDTDA